MVRQDFETEQITLKLRDAFRILCWKCFRPDLKQSHLGDCYTQFTSRWNKSSIRSMDYCELAILATSKGFSIEQLLLVREIYYGIHKRIY